MVESHFRKLAGFVVAAWRMVGVGQDWHCPGKRGDLLDQGHGSEGLEKYSSAGINGT